MSTQPLSPLEQLAGTPDPQAPSGDTSGLSPLEQLAATPPDTSGTITNDVGNTVVVPKNPGTDQEESFADTLKRAVDAHKAMSAAQQQEAIDKETGTIPKKAAEVALSTPVAASLPIIGAEGLLAGHAALSAGFKALAPALQRGIVGIGEWAEAHPYARAALVEALREVGRGTALYQGAKATSKVLHSSGE